MDGCGLRLGRSGGTIPRTINLVCRGGNSQAVILWGTSSQCQRRTDSMSQHHPVRAAIYARVSTERQAEVGTIASQVDALRARVRQDELYLEDTLCFIDDGYTGTSLVRPALDRLRDQAAGGSVD